MTHYDLEGRVAIVTGASGGLGEQFAHALAGCGATIVVAARSGTLLRRLADQLREEHRVKALPVETDVSREADVVRLVARTIEEFGTVDVLVNNAGMYIAKPLIDQTLDDWHRVMDVNLTSAFLCCREVAKVMIPQRSGTIVNIASTFAFGGTVFPEVSYVLRLKGRARCADKGAGGRARQERDPGKRHSPWVLPNLHVDRRDD